MGLSKKVKEIFTGSEVGALVEDFNSKMELVTEQYGDIKKDTASINQGLGMLKEDVGVIKMDIEFIKHELRNKINRDEFIALEHRVSLLENRR